jgi:excisionase family DNA binding protein
MDMARLTISCKSFQVRHESEHLVLEIEEAKPANVVSQLMSKVEVASRLSISVRKVEEFARSGDLPIVRIGGAVRFRETDVLSLQNKNLGPKARVIELKRKKAA